MAAHDDRQAYPDCGRRKVRRSVASRSWARSIRVARSDPTTQMVNVGCNPTDCGATPHGISALVAQRKGTGFLSRAMLVRIQPGALGL